MLHIRHFHITDRSARRKLLELGFEFQFIERIDFLGHMNMVAVRNVVFTVTPGITPNRRGRHFAKRYVVDSMGVPYTE